MNNTEKLEKHLASLARGTTVIAIPESCGISNAVEHKRLAVELLKEDSSSPAVVESTDHSDVSFVFGFKENLLKSETYRQKFIKECDNLNLEFIFISLV